jgi:hypothetical protein
LSPVTFGESVEKLTDSIAYNYQNTNDDLSQILLVPRAQSAFQFSVLYLGSSRCARPLPRSLTGHVARPTRSIQFSDFSFPRFSFLFLYSFDFAEAGTTFSAHTRVEARFASMSFIHTGCLVSG